MANPKEEPSKTVDPSGEDVEQNPSACPDGGGGYKGRGIGRGRGCGRGGWNRKDSGQGTASLNTFRTKLKGAMTAIEAHAYKFSST